MKRCLAEPGVACRTSERADKLSRGFHVGSAVALTNGDMHFFRCLDFGDAVVSHDCSGAFSEDLASTALQS